MLLASGVATAAIAASAQPAQAGVVVSVGVGGGYAPGYHWYRWQDGYGWHRRWVPLGWVAPVAFRPGPFYPGRPVGYARPVYWAHGWYGHPRPGYWR
jgi:hypothetical protein